MNYYYLGIEYNPATIIKNGSMTVYSELQEAEVQFFAEKDGSISARHCGVTEGSFYTDCITILESWEWGN
jgi:hypothetical protein